MKVRLKRGEKLHVGSFVFEAGEVYDVEPTTDISRLVKRGVLEVVKDEMKRQKEVSE
ncbi:hypothetical protein [Geoglobus acetivorans]|uniref:Uncharacterized protein n=1 Tax=Geoglobus acetivorans TaxID=565033 RepID=A0ABZ3H4I2_GEOAI|nr:hypothetical protein [Geoglobus acetivorans]